MNKMELHFWLKELIHILKDSEAITLEQFKELDEKLM